MPIRIPCKCKANLAIADHLAGKNVRCPKCKAVLRVPTAEEVARAAEPTMPMAAPERAGIEARADTAMKRRKAREDLRKIREELVGQQQGQVRYIPPNAGKGRARESEPTMMMDRRPPPAAESDDLEQLKSEPVPGPGRLKLEGTDGGRAGEEPGTPPEGGSLKLKTEGSEHVGRFSEPTMQLSVNEIKPPAESRPPAPPPAPARRNRNLVLAAVAAAVIALVAWLLLR